MKKDGDSGGRETPQQFPLNFSLADVLLGEKGDAALFEVTKSLARVFIQSILPLGKYERHCATTCSPLLTNGPNLWETSFLYFFFIILFILLFILQPCSWQHTLFNQVRWIEVHKQLCVQGFELFFFFVLFFFSSNMFLPAATQEQAWASATKPLHLVTPRDKNAEFDLLNIVSCTWL